LLHLTPRKSNAEKIRNLFGVSWLTKHLLLPWHQHLVCTHCRKIVAFRRPEVQRIQDEVARAHGFLPARHKLEVYGLCPDCRAAGVELTYEGLACPALTL
jgi:Fe2+ or Zn2+ uptake regulation protein